MICRYCKCNISDDSRYCEKCGKSQESLHAPVISTPEILQADDKEISVRNQTCQEIHDPNKVKPITRFLARNLDWFFFGIVLAVLAGAVFPSLFMNGGLLKSSFTFGFVIVFTWAFVEPFFLTLFGTTPGKFLFNTRVVDSHGKNLNLALAFKRSFNVWVGGCGAGTIVALYTYSKSYSKLKTKKITDWDKSINSSVIHGRVGFIRITALMVCLFGWIYLYGLTIMDSLATKTEKSNTTQPAQITWEKFYATEGNFKIEFPTHPKRETTTKNKISNSKITFDQTSYMSIDSDQSSYIVVYYVYSDKIKREPKDMLNDAMNASIYPAGLNAELLYSKFVTFHQYPALDYVVKDKDNIYVRSRLILTDNKTMYGIFASFANTDSSKYDKFLNSFELVGK